MNYIKQLIKRDLTVMTRALEKYDEGIDEILRYLTSPKFHEDPTVQVQDVINRIEDARMAVTPVLDKLSDKTRYPSGRAVL